MAPFEIQTTEIDTTPEELFDFLTVIDTIPDWYDGWDDVTHDGETPKLQVGTSFRLASRLIPRSASCRVVEATAPTRLSWNEYGPEGTTVRVTFRLEPAKKGMSLLTLSKRLIAAI